MGVAARTLIRSMAVTLLWATASPAQSPQGMPRSTEPGFPAWMIRWSPLRPVATQPRELPDAARLPRFLLQREPRVGPLWTAGNPAGLPRAVDRRWNRLALRGASEDGDFRRPMDFQDIGVIGFNGYGWEPVGDGAALGRIIIDREAPDRAPFADVLEPHASNPLVMADSSIPAMRRNRARLEGAFGWRFGAWSVGASAGVEVRDHRTEDASLPRVGRMSRQGVAIGVGRELPFEGLELALQGRWVGGAETMSLFLGPGGGGTLFLLQGYAEPRRVVIGAQNRGFFRRMERDAWAWDVAIAGDLAGADWVLGWESAWRDEEQFSQRMPGAPIDVWESDGSALYAAAQRRFLDDRLTATLNARYSTLTGDARRADLPDPVFDADEDVLVATADLRYRAGASPWTFGLVLSVKRESRTRRDRLAEVRSEVESWTPALGVEAVARLGGSTNVSLGAGFSFYSATWVLPNPASMGPVYRLLIAPELALYATAANPAVAEFGLRQELSGTVALTFEARGIWTRPETPPEVLAGAPNGDRSLWELSLALTLQ